MMETKKIVERSLCCGCGVCAEICKHDAVKMLADEEGFLYPHIDAEKCVNCDLCIASCPILNVEKIQIASHNQKVCAGFFNDTNDLLSCASGGIATAISRKIIQAGGVVYGVSYSPDFRRAEFVKAASIGELEKFKGSKYIQARKDGIYSDAARSLKSGVKVLFIGLPCEIGGLKSYLKEDYENLYTCELICYGPTSEKIAKEYIDRIENEQKSELTEFSVRYKKDRWTPPYLRAVFQNGSEVLKPFYETDYGQAFSTFPRPSCNSCTYKGDKRVADLTVGDYWGCTPNDAFWNKNGVSAIFVHTGKGGALLSDLPEFTLTESTYRHAVSSNPMIHMSRKKPEKRDLFSELLIKDGLSMACRKTKSLKDICVKLAAQCIPGWLRPLAVKAYRVIKH